MEIEQQGATGQNEPQFVNLPSVSESAPGPESGEGWIELGDSDTVPRIARLNVPEQERQNLKIVLDKLAWMEHEKIWPNGLRYLWTDAHGILLLVSLFRHTGDKQYLAKAESVVADVNRVLGRAKGVRIGEAPKRDGQYYHYLTKWMYALNELGQIKPRYREDAIQIAKDIHPHFCIKGRGILWKMKEDLSRAYPGYGFGGLDHYDGYMIYRLLDDPSLEQQVNDLKELVMKSFKGFHCTQDLGLGESMWMAHHFADEDWAKFLKQRSQQTLDSMWVEAEDGGYFCREQHYSQVILAFGNFGVSYGLQSWNIWPERVKKLHQFFSTFKSGDKYDEEAITHVMHCNSLFPGVMIKRQ